MFLNKLLIVFSLEGGGRTFRCLQISLISRRVSFPNIRVRLRYRC
jgi:hypothetical protein